MTKKEDLRVVKPTTTVDEALEMLVNHRITGFPVIDDDWKLVFMSSCSDLEAFIDIHVQEISITLNLPITLEESALETPSGLSRSLHLSRVFQMQLLLLLNSHMTFSEIQKLLGKTNGKVIGDLMTSAPLVVHEATNLEDAARILLETKYHHLPVVDSSGNLLRLRPPASPLLSLGSSSFPEFSYRLSMSKVGIITRGNVIRAALQIKHETEKRSRS